MALRAGRTAAALAVGAVAVAQAAQWVVDDDGTAHFRTLQAAVAAAYVHPGDTLLVKPGRYSGAVWLTKDLVIRSEAGPFDTILDGNGEGSVLALENRSVGTRIEGFTITGGIGDTGGGIWIYGGAPVITRNIIEGNSAVGGYFGYGYGGGIEIYSAAPVITRNVIRGNTAVDGGGGIDVYYAGPATPGTCCPVLAQNTIVDNTVTGPAGIGGGILVVSSQPLVSSSIIAGNDSAAGGGIYAQRLGNNDSPDVRSNILFANAPDDDDASWNWHIPASNAITDPRLGQGPSIELWPRSNSPALDAAASGLPAGPDLAGNPGAQDGNLDGAATPDIGALEGRGEITGVRAAADAVLPGAVALSWDDSVNPAVVFNVYASDLAPFVTDGGWCLGAGLGVTQLTDPDPLAAGEVRFYLVTGSAAFEGPRGWRSDGTARPNSPTCVP